MGSVKLDIQWSPVHHNKFITWGTEINLYEVVPLEDSFEQSCLKISDHSVAHLLATNTNNHYVKCIDIYPEQEPDILLAVGQANGKVVLNTFGPTAYDSLGFTGKEFVPKHARPCNVVAWNPVDKHLILSGLDKHSKDHSVLLWDIDKNPQCSERIHHHGSNQMECIRPTAELGVSETIHSAAWFKHDPKCLVLGANNKQLKILDFRDSARVVNVTPTKAVYNVSVNPHHTHHLVSNVDNQIIMWDVRCFDKPVLTLVQLRQITKVLWCPTRRNLLGALQKDSGALHLYDIQNSGGEDTEPGVLERAVVPSWHIPVNFSWHPTHVNRLLAISQQGITDYTVWERITVSWSSGSHLTWNHAFKSLKYIHSEDNPYKTLDDIAILTKKRANAEYGLLPDLAQNGELAENETLKHLWQWLYLSGALVEDGTIHSVDNKHPGIRTVLKLDGQQNPMNGFLKSELIHRTWTDIGSNYTAKIYRSADRDKSLLLCGLRFDKETNGLYDNTYLEGLEREGAYARAAALAVFNLCLRQAIEILNRGATKMSMTANLDIVAMALSGFSEDRNSMWRESCLKSRSQLPDPYLRATFAFLTADNDSYENVLNESGMAVEDRVAFALMFLSDSKLHDYLRRLTQKLTEEGNLAGFLLTGASMEGIQLLNRYLEITGDAQSCSLIAIRALTPKLLQENQVQVWIANYRNLLDAWKMWNQRAQFDIAMRSSTNETPPQQIYVSCNFCGKSIAAFMQGLSRARAPFGRLGSTSNKLKMSACPNCRKPLPRCAICLMYMGTVSGLTTSSVNRSEDCDSKLTEFNNWFTWCQTCKHGGHAEHITQWFRQHSECPVTSCTCRCLSLDTSAK
ncbi:GATOR complex protein MIOS [Harpegnathos saltator]|uniref:WD repeat-containing protein mio n=1 Tax=Harpegnathos saltator TaxID=610380 RepID=E2BJ86_HARSA|nr:GATOR complex protein MIOS [Harpegnathos saltator]EFN84236.1 WD repeat-containing protein mio [Harpegnathos saltator]